MNEIKKFESQNEFLVQKGFTKVRKNINLLIKFNGDQTQALETLQFKLNKKIEKKSKK